MKITKLDISVAILAGLTCFGLLIKLPVWALFIGWAWYFALGATPAAFKQAIPAMFVGYILASVTIMSYAASGYSIWVMVAAVAVTVFILMLSLKVTPLGCALSSFNGYSCMFAGYYAGNFPKTVESSLEWKNIAVCILWIALANILGLICGLISVWFGNLGQKTDPT